jgi:hypothetical protein
LLLIHLAGLSELDADAGISANIAVALIKATTAV